MYGYYSIFKKFLSEKRGKVNCKLNNAYCILKVIKDEL